MCEQCSAECVEIAEIVEGWWLYKANKDGNRMRKGAYALGCGDDPTFYFTVIPIPEPFANLSDEELDGLPVSNMDKLKEFWRIVEQVGKSLVCDPYTGYKFYQACLKSGYDPNIHGTHLDYWLTNAMGIAIRARDN